VIDSECVSLQSVRVQCCFARSTSPRFHSPNNNNNLCLIMVKTNRSTLHTVYNMQQSATQDSNDTTHRLSHRTAATTRFSPEGTGCGCQKRTAPRFCQHPIRWAFTSQAFTRWRHLSTHPINRPATQYSFIDPGRMRGWVGLIGWLVADGLPT